MYSLFLFIMSHILENLITWFGTLSYLDIFILMMMESSIIPVPSEFVMIPAGWIAETG